MQERAGHGEAVLQRGITRHQKKHQRKVRAARKPNSVSEYESDEESEDEYEAVVVDDTMLRGMDIAEDAPEAIDAIAFDDYVSTGDPKKRGRHRGNYGPNTGRDLNS